MNKINILSVLLSLMFHLTMTSAFATSEIENAAMAQKADLKVSKIAPVGSYCIGNKNKIRVTVTNSQRVAVKQKILVKLTVKQGNHSVTYDGYINNGIGPSDNYGQHAFFNNIKFISGSGIELKAVVNPKRTIPETVYTNNTKKRNLRKTYKQCGSTTTNAQTAKLTLTVYESGTWAGPNNYQPINHAQVRIRKGSFDKTGITGSNGKVTIPNIPKGSGYKIEVTKSGCPTNYDPYTMPSYNANKNVQLNCN